MIILYRMHFNPMSPYSLPREMFYHINKKGMQTIVHYLFNRLDSHIAYEEFRYIHSYGSWQAHTHVMTTCTCLGTVGQFMIKSKRHNFVKCVLTGLLELPK